MTRLTAVGLGLGTNLAALAGACSAACGNGGSGGAAEGGVLARRPNPDTSTNFQSRFRVEGTRRPAKSTPVPSKAPRIVRLLAQAEHWHRLLDSGEVRSRAEIARRAGVSAMRVMQVLRR